MGNSNCKKDKSGSYPNKPCSSEDNLLINCLLRDETEAPKKAKSKSRSNLDYEDEYEENIRKLREYINRNYDQYADQININESLRIKISPTDPWLSHDSSNNGDYDFNVSELSPMVVVFKVPGPGGNEVPVMYNTANKDRNHRCCPNCPCIDLKTREKILRDEYVEDLDKENNNSIESESSDIDKLKMLNNILNGNADAMSNNSNGSFGFYGGAKKSKSKTQSKKKTSKNVTSTVEEFDLLNATDSDSDLGLGTDSDTDSEFNLSAYNKMSDFTSSDILYNANNRMYSSDDDDRYDLNHNSELSEMERTKVIQRAMDAVKQKKLSKKTELIGRFSSEDRKIMDLTPDSPDDVMKRPFAKNIKYT